MLTMRMLPGSNQDAVIQAGCLMEAHLGTHAALQGLQQLGVVEVRIPAVVDQVGPELELPITDPTAPGEAGEKGPSQHTLHVCACRWPCCTAEAHRL